MHCLKIDSLAQNSFREDFSAPEIATLMKAGYVTSSPHPLHSGSLASPHSSLSSETVSIPIISRAPSGSLAAVGGEKAIYDAGGRGGMRRSSQFSKEQEQESGPETHQFPDDREDLRLSLPNTGPYLKILTAARSHLVSLILKSRFKEMPEYLLRERWEGGVSADDSAAKAKKYRGEFAGILPSRTRKWKQFYGLSFNWVLAECLGAGLVEVFETGSVGRAVRTL